MTEETRPPADSQSPDASAGTDLTGQQLDDYKILRRIGQGGMGQVYLAHQLSLRRQVVLKVLKHELAEGANAAAALARFKAEAEAMARATHANIVQIHAIGRARGLNYMALEYVEGRNLHEFVERKKPISVGAGLKVMAQVAAALQRAGELNIVHRDIKPENILISRAGEVKVADFGLSRCFDRQVSLTATGVALGTPLYMSPEQVEGTQPIDQRSDIYSFGATCYFMFAAQPPFRGETPIEVAYKHVHTEPEPLGELCPDLPAELCAMIHKMMSKRPEARYQTAADVARDVARLQGESSGTLALEGQPSVRLLIDSQEALPYRAPSGVATTERPRYGVTALTIVLALVAGLAIGWLNRGPAPLEDIVPDDNPGIGPDKREVDLLKQVKDGYKPHGPLDPKMLSGLNAAVELSLLYLSEHRLDEADSLFNELCPLPRGERCHAELLCQLGRASVLAFRGASADSNVKFLEAFVEIDRLEKRQADAKGAKDSQSIEDEVAVYVLLWKTTPPAAALREMVARALDHNHRNGPNFPPTLEQYRHPPRPAPTLP